MAIESRAFVKPSLGKSRIYADCKNIFVAVIYKIRDVKTERSVAAEVLAYIMSVQHYHCVPEHAVKFYGDALSGVGCRKIKHSAIPPDASFRKIAADWFCAVVGEFVATCWFAV